MNKILLTAICLLLATVPALAISVVIDNDAAITYSRDVVVTMSDLPNPCTNYSVSIRNQPGTYVSKSPIPGDPCSFNWTLRSGEGTKTVYLRAVSQIFPYPTSQGSDTIRLALNPPNTSITSNPPNPSSSPDAIFTFTGNDSFTPVNQLQYSYRLDSGAWSAFSGTTTAIYTSLPQGIRLFEVKARDTDFLEDPTPAQYVWTIQNNPPTINVDLTPDLPTTDQALTCTGTTSDLDGHTVTATYQFTGGYTDTGNATCIGNTCTVTVPTTQTTKAETITCTMTPNDGYTDGTPDSDSVTILNTPPTITVLEPNGNDTADASFTVQWTANDIDSIDTLLISCHGDDDSAGYDTTFFGFNNTANDGGQAINLTAWPNADYYMWCQADDGTDIARDYSPDVLTVRHNVVPEILGATINPDPAYDFSDLTCGYVYYDDDGDPEGASTFAWYENGVLIPGQTANILDSSLTSLGASYVCEVTPVAQTGASPGNPVNSNPITIQPNNPPTASNLAISPAPAYNSNDLSCSYDYSDPEGDPEGTSTFAWYQNGVLIVAQTNQILPNTATNVGDSYYCQVTPVASQGGSPGNPAQSFSLIVNADPNAAPEALNVAIVPSLPGDTDDLFCSYTYFDADGDPEGTSTFAWYQNGTIIPGETSQTLNNTQTSPGNNYFCEITPRAQTGASPGSVVQSTAVSIQVTGNSPPEAQNVQINPSIPYTENDLTCNYTYFDDDGDPEGASTFAWYQNGALMPTQTGQTLASASTVAGNTYECEVTPIALTGSSPGTPVRSLPVIVNGNLNLPPIASNVYIWPDPANSSQDLICYYTYSDNEGDSEGLTQFAWYENGFLMAGETSQTLLSSSTTQLNDYICQVTPVALSGASPGADVNSAPLTLQPTPNNPPIITVIQPDGILDNADQNYTVTWVANDPDLNVITVNCYADDDNAGYDVLYTAFTGEVDDGTELIDTSTWTDGDYYIWCDASDGIDSGTDYSDGPLTVYHNRVPEAQNVFISPDPAYTTDNLACNYTYLDTEGDPEGTSTFAWYQNSALMAGETSQTLNSALTTKADVIICQVTPIALTGASPGLDMNSAPLTISNTPPVILITLPTGAGDNADQNYTIEWITADADSDPLTISCYRDNDNTGYETTNPLFVGGTNDGNELIDTSTWPNGDYYIWCQADDGTDTNRDYSDGPLTVYHNEPPVASNVYITPDPAYTNDNLACDYTYSDTEGDPEGASTFAWYQNGGLIPGENNQTLSSIYTTKGDVIICQVTPIALTGASPGLDVNSTPLTISNSPPVIVVTEPDGVGGDNADQNYLIEWITADADSDPLTISCYRDNDNTGYETTNPLFVGVANDGNELIDTSTWPNGDYYIWCEADDGTDTNSDYSDGPLTVYHNQLPFATNVAISPDPAYTTDLLTCNYTYNDTEGDPEGTSTFAWYQNSALMAGETSQTLNSALTTKADVMICQVTPIALTGPSPGLDINSAPLTISNSPPAITVTEPDGIGDTADLTYTIQWTTSDSDSDTLSVSCYADDDSTGYDIVYTAFTGTIDDGSQAADTTLWTNNNYYIWCEADDGTDTNRDYSAGVLTIAHPNSPPQASGVNITPAGPQDADDLSCNYTYFDPEGDLEGATSLAWYENSVLMAGQTNQVLNNANTVIGNSYVCQVTPIALTGSSPGADVNSVPVIVLAGPNNPPSITVIEPDGNSDTADTNYTIQWNASDVDGQPLTISCYRDNDNTGYETTNPIFVGGADDGNEYVDTNSWPSADYYIWCQADDGVDTTQDYSDGPLTVSHPGNAAPVASNVNITPDSASTSDTLTCNYTYSDAEGDAEGATIIRWRYAGTVIATGPILGNGLTSSGRTYVCQVIPRAVSGTTPGAMASDSITLSGGGSPGGSHGGGPGPQPPADDTDTNADGDDTGGMDYNGDIVLPGDTGGDEGGAEINHGPFIEIIQPDGNQDTADQNYLVEWIASDVDGDVLFVSCYADNNSQGFGVVYTAFTGAENDGNQLIDVSGWEEGEYFVWCKATDGIDTNTDYSQGPLEVDRGIALPGALASLITWSPWLLFVLGLLFLIWFFLLRKPKEEKPAAKRPFAKKTKKSK